MHPAAPEWKGIWDGSGALCDGCLQDGGSALADFHGAWCTSVQVRNLSERVGKRSAGGIGFSQQAPTSLPALSHVSLWLFFLRSMMLQTKHALKPLINHTRLEEKSWRRHKDSAHSTETNSCRAFFSLRFNIPFVFTPCSPLSCCLAVSLAF